ncbi:hypothetical protein JCM6882_008113 [Rhodosporidiobolus microsporus]
MSVLQTQQYGPVVTEDPALSDSDFSPPPRPPSSRFVSQPLPSSSAFVFRSQLSTPHGLQRALDEHPPPPELNGATVWLIRAFPILATLSWFATLVTLLSIWLFVDHKPKYRWYLGSMPYLSNVGADNKTIFLVGNICTAVFFVMSLLQERLLRAKRVMVEATEEKHLWVGIGVLDVLIGLLGGLALILLAIFDAFNYPKEHNAFMTTFIVCVTLSGLLQTLEVEHLWHEHPDRHDLRDGTLLKWATLLLSASCGAAFWILYAVCDGDATKVEEWPYPTCYRITTASALLEWAACFGCAFYLSTLILDVWPLHRHSSPTPVVWADKGGVKGVWVVHPSFRQGKKAVDLPEGVALHRPPVHGGDLLGAQGQQGKKRCALVLVPHPVHSGGMVPLARATKREGDGGDDGYGWAWYSEGKGSGRRKKKERR